MWPRWRSIKLSSIGQFWHRLRSVWCSHGRVWSWVSLTTPYTQSGGGTSSPHIHGVSYMPYSSTLENLGCQRMSINVANQIWFWWHASWPRIEILSALAYQRKAFVSTVHYLGSPNHVSISSPCVGRWTISVALVQVFCLGFTGVAVEWLLSIGPFCHGRWGSSLYLKVSEED